MAEAKSLNAAERKEGAIGKCGATLEQASTVAPSSLQGYFSRLQQTHGNKTVQQLLRAHLPQAKLIINHPGDEYEQEADRVADQVTRMLDTSSIKPVTASHTEGRAIQRRNSSCERLETEVSSEVETRIEQARSSGRGLDNGVRFLMESTFGADFSDVRIHADSRADILNREVNAVAFTTGQDIFFRQGMYAPGNSAGRQLLAHELAHVVQQRGAVASATKAQRMCAECEEEGKKELHRKPIPGGGATPGTGEGIDLIFIVELPRIGYIKDVTHYVKTVLHGQEYHEVSGLDDVFAYLSQAAKHGQRVRRIRLVSHGLVTGRVATINEEHIAAVWIGPKEVTQYARRNDIKAIVQKVMTPGAVVEFWGCNIGRSQEAGKAWAGLFHSTFRATTETFRTAYDRFPRPARKGEKGFAIPGREGKWVTTRNSKEMVGFADDHIVINGRHFTLGGAFRLWLLSGYEDLVANGDLLPVDDRGTEEERTLRKLELMIEIFDRADGDIRHIVVTARSDPKAQHPIRPGDQKHWAQMWVTFPPVEVSEMLEGKMPQGSFDRPAVPSHPRAASKAEPSAKTQAPQHPMAQPTLHPPQVEHPPSPRTRPLIRGTTPAEAHATSREGIVLGDSRCHPPDSAPAGSLFALVPFGFDQDDVVDKGHVDVAKFVASLGKDSRQQRIRVDGYASTDGPEDYNRRLSCRRALAVKNELVKGYRIPEDHISLYAHGETSEFSDTDRTKNRVAILTASPAFLGNPSTLQLPSQVLETPARGLPPAPVGPGRQGLRDDPHLLLTGRDTAAAVAKILPTADPIMVSSSLGDVELKPGTIWDGHKMLIYASPMSVYYTIGANLYESSTSTFLRAYYLDALAHGAARAKFMITLAKAEIAFLEGIFVPWYLMLAMTVAKAGLFYHFHKHEVHVAVEQVPNVIRLLREFHSRYPTLFDKLAYKAGKEIILDLPSGVEAEDVAFFLGRVIRGIGGLEEMSLDAFLKMVRHVFILVAALHLPSIAVHGVEEAAKNLAAEVQAALEKEGVFVSEEEAGVIMRELLTHPDAAQRLKVLQAALQELVPVLEELGKALRE